MCPDPEWIETTIETKSVRRIAEVLCRSGRGSLGASGAGLREGELRWQPAPPDAGQGCQCQDLSCRDDW